MSKTEYGFFSKGNDKNLVEAARRDDELVNDRTAGPNSRKEGVLLIFLLIIESMRWIFTFFIVFMVNVFTNGMKLLVFTGLFVGSIFLRKEGLDIRDAIETGDEEKLSRVVRTSANFFIMANILVSLTQIGISFWNISIRPMLIIIMLAYQIVRPMIIFLFAVFGDIFIEGALFMSEVLIVLVTEFSGVLSEMSGSFGAGAPETNYGPGFTGGLFESESFGSATGADDPVFGGVIGMFAPITRLLVRIFQILIKGFARFFVRMGFGILVFGDFFVSIVLKFMPIFVDILNVIVDILNPKKALGLLIFSMANVLYGIQWSLYSMCWQFKNIFSLICPFISLVNKALKKLKSKLGINLDLPDPCNNNQLGMSCGKKPKAPTFGNSGFGAGLCDESQCIDDTIAIMQNLQMLMPNCADWTNVNGNSSRVCMDNVHQYAQTNLTTSISASPIATISKELCFVLTAVIVSQCQNLLPPFGFSQQLVAADICVLDKSGLSPPAATFNTGCACVYNTPLCEDDCCNQYSLHVIGQIKSHVGDYQCGTILSLFTEDFWCQYQYMNTSFVSGQPDLSYSSNWCAAFKLVVEPACFFSSPLVTLNSLDLSAMIPAFSAQFCNSTVNQTGVCLPINTLTDPDFIQMQYDQVLTETDDLYASLATQAQLGFPGTPIQTTPFLFDTTDTIIEKDIKKYYCYYFTMMFNQSNPLFTTRYRSVLRVASEYCAGVIVDVYASFTFGDVMGAKLRTSSGQIAPINMIGLPPNTLVFGSSVGAGLPATSNDQPDCGYQTGASVVELDDQGGCSAQVMQSNEQTLDTVDSSATEGMSGLDQATTTFIPANHLTTTSGTIDPSDPDYEQKTTDRNTMNVAKTQPTDWHTVPASQQTDETSTYMRVYTEGTDIGDAEFTQRHLSSLNIDREPEDPMGFLSRMGYYMNEIKDAVRSISASAKHIMANAKISTKPGGIKEPVFSERNAERGKVIVKSYLRILAEELAQVRANKMNSSHPENFKTMRKLTAAYNYGNSPTINASIHSFWDRLADMHGNGASGSGVSQEALDEYYTEEVKKDINYLTKNGWKNAYALFNLFYNMNFSSSDFGFASGINPEADYTGYGGYGANGEFGAATGAEDGEKCRNSQEEPLKCCEPGVSSYDCCRGTPNVCIPELAKWLYSTVTTRENVEDQWYCDKFVNFGDYLWNVMRCLVTVTFRAFSLVTGSRGIYVDIFGPLVYDDLKMPTNWLGCSIVYSLPIWGGLLAFFVFYVFIQSQRFVEMSILIMQRNDIITLWSKVAAIKKELKAAKKK